MQIPMQITVRNMPHSIALDKHIREKIRELEEHFSPIVSCHVVVDLPHRHLHGGRQCNVRIDLSVPKQEIFVNLDHHEDVYAALRNAFDSAQRLLNEYANRQRHGTAALPEFRFASSHEGGEVGTLSDG